MPAATDRMEFAPPPEPAAVRGFVFAVIAHLMLLLALTWGINWKRESENVVAEAELWASVPQQAAPRVVTAPPLPAPAPAPTPAPPAPPPPPPPAPRVEAPPPAPVPAKQPDIALEREKKKQELAERRREELERQKKVEARKLLEEREREKKLEARRKQEELEREKKLEAQKKQEELKRQQLAQQKAEAAKEKAREQADAKRLAALREENLKRMQGLAVKAAPTAQGDAERSSGPSGSYAGRIQAKVRPNIVFTDDIVGNPKAEVEVRMAPDGTITSRRLVKSSGVKSWDEAVLRALDRTEVLPRDVDGRVHSPLTIDFRPKS